MAVNQADRQRARCTKPKVKLKIIYELISVNAMRERERERARVNEACWRLSIAGYRGSRLRVARVAPEDKARRRERDSRDTSREGSALLSEFQRNVKLRITQAITLLG